MRKKHSEELKSSDSEGAFGICADEMVECGIYDATCLNERNETTHKRQRKVFKNQSIRVRFLLRNPLLTDISISNLRLCCRYIKPDQSEETKEEEDDLDDEESFRAESLEMQLPS